MQISGLLNFDVFLGKIYEYIKACLSVTRGGRTLVAGLFLKGRIKTEG